MTTRVLKSLATLVALGACTAGVFGDDATAKSAKDSEFFERRIRPLLAKHCYECHSEEGKSREGGLLLDRRSGWMEGGASGKSIVPGEPDASLLITAIRYGDDELQMPPEEKLDERSIRLLEEWIRRGAPGPQVDKGETEFSRLGDQEYLFERAKEHWAFQPVEVAEPPAAADPPWNENAIDRFVFGRLAGKGLKPSPAADARTLIRRLSFDLTGLPPTPDEVAEFTEAYEGNADEAVQEAVDRLLSSPAYGEHIARMWLDVARYADTDSFYRPDTRTPHFFPFAFAYRDYVINAFREDTPFDEFVREQLAADLLGRDESRIAALGFLAVGPHANRNQSETVDDWIDATTRGFLGLTAACARCHDHKYEPIPTTDYYALHGVFSSVRRVHPLDEEQQPLVPGYEPTEADRADFERKRAVIDAKIEKQGGRQKPEGKKLRETELAELLLFHPASPARAMIVREKSAPVDPYVFLRGDPRSRGDSVPRRFVTVLDPEGEPFPADNSGRLELAERIVDPSNPLTARVYVNRVWGFVTGSHLVDTPSDFGLQGSSPSHPQLLDWLADSFVRNGWSTKQLVRQIVLSRTYRQQSRHRPTAAEIDPTNQLLWRAERRHLSIEALRDAMLSVSGQLDPKGGGHAGRLWNADHTRRRSVYGYVNRFNLDPTLRAFDFPSPMQSHAVRGESIVPTQALFTLNSGFVIDQAVGVTKRERFQSATTDADRIDAIFSIALQRSADEQEVAGVKRFLELQQRFAGEPLKSPGAETWALVAQSLMMSNEFQYVD